MYLVALRLRCAARPLLATVLCQALLAASGAGCARPTAPPADAPDPRGVATLVQAAERAAEIGDHDAAISAWQAAFERTPWNTRLRDGLIAAYAERAAAARERKGAARLGAAADDLRTALAVAPDDHPLRPELSRNLAVCLADLAAYVSDPAEAAALRAEAAQLDADVASAAPRVDLTLERRLDLAYELLERGQLEAGIARLERVVHDHPERPDAARLLAQARVRRGMRFADRGNWPAAAAELGRATALYAELLPCDGARCDAAELELAHHNRIVALLEARDFAAARAALAEARALGLRFPELARAAGAP